MSKIFLTSDCHFFHQNIISYCNRPFDTIEEMNEALIKNWNSVVTYEDTVYVLGDFFMGRTEWIDSVLCRLNGKIILIRGNHDSGPRIEHFKSKGIEVKDIDYIRYKGRFFILNHFPNESKDFMKMICKDNSEVVWLYGHVHDNAPKGYVNGTYHVGADTNNYTPISLDQIWKECWPDELMKSKEIKDYKTKYEKENVNGWLD